MHRYMDIVNLNLNLISVLCGVYNPNIKIFVKKRSIIRKLRVFIVLCISLLVSHTDKYELIY